MKQPEAEETTLSPQVMPFGKTARENEECWHPSRAGSPAGWRPAEPREQPVTGLASDHENGPPSPEFLNSLLDNPEAVLRLLKTPREYEKALYQAVWQKYGSEAGDRHAEKTDILQALFNNDNLPVDMYPVMLKACPSLFSCRPGRDRFLRYADDTFSSLWNDIPD